MILWKATGKNVQKFTIHESECGQRIDRYISKYFRHLSFGKIQKMLREKDIKVNGRKVSGDYRLEAGDEISVFLYEKAEPVAKDATTGTFMLKAKQIVYEDEDILIYNKAANQLAQSAQRDGEDITAGLVNYLRHKGEYDPEKQKTFSPAFINRLDANTQGLMFGVKNYLSARTYSALAGEGKIKKYYTALLCGVAPEKKTHKAYHLKDTKTKTARIGSHPRPGAKAISTTVMDVASNRDFHLCKILLDTGKFHQIRAHMAYLNAPVVGDGKYGNAAINEIVRRRHNVAHQLLIADELVFALGDEIKRIKIEVPEKFMEVFTERQ